jgi:hypothetical protein
MRSAWTPLLLTAGLGITIVISKAIEAIVARLAFGRIEEFKSLSELETALKLSLARIGCYLAFVTWLGLSLVALIVSWPTVVPVSWYIVAGGLTTLAVIMGLQDPR